MKPVAKKPPVRRPAARKAAIRTGKRSARPAPRALADRVIYDSPLKPRHLSPAQIESIVDELPGWSQLERMGVPKATYDRSVFLNCPFDEAYKPILDAIVFCVHDSGFVAEIALNDIGTGKTRLAKIVEMIGRCRYSIHDLSRVDEPRLNMAFECGICYGSLTFGTGRHKRKDLFVLDAEEHRYKKTMSDIAGQDADVHHNDPLKAIDCVRSFLARKSGVKPFPGATYIAQRYRRFSDALPIAASAAKVTVEELKTLKYLPDLVNLMVAWQQKNP